MRPYVIFDLDGVLVDNLEYEEAVTDQIIHEISLKRRLPLASAKDLWRVTLNQHRGHPRWHDYELHCAAIGLPDAWRLPHESLRQLIRPMANAKEALALANNLGVCWLASDATSWVVDLKLEAVGINPSLFEEIFTVDRCLASKGDQQYWEMVKGSMDSVASPAVYIDNRLDRLMAAAGVLPNCRMLHVATKDHPVSIGFLSKFIQLDSTVIREAMCSEMPSALKEFLEDLV